MYKPLEKYVQTTWIKRIKFWWMEYLGTDPIFWLRQRQEELIWDMDPNNNFEFPEIWKQTKSQY